MPFARRRRHIAAVNISLCFPELSDEKKRKLVARHFESLGKGLVECALAWWGKQETLEKIVNLEGLEHLRRAVGRGKGVILLGGHYTTLEISGALMAIACPIPFQLVYRPHENPLLNKVIRNGRKKRLGTPIARNDMKTMLRALKKGKVVWFASDQNFRHRNSVFSPFFNVPAATNTAPVRLVKVSGASVLPFSSHRSADGKRYVLRIRPPLADFPSDDPQRDMARVNRTIEEQVREFPEQYLWIHRRFKSRPPGCPDVYGAPRRASLRFHC